jgi:hypothetical protein
MPIIPLNVPINTPAAHKVARVRKLIVGAMVAMDAR